MHQQIKSMLQRIETYGVPTFIKVDAEGYEPLVLQGLSQPIKALPFEYSRYRSGDVYARLKS